MGRDNGAPVQARAVVLMTRTPPGSSRRQVVPGAPAAPTMTFCDGSAGAQSRTGATRHTWACRPGPWRRGRRASCCTNVQQTIDLHIIMITCTVTAWMLLQIPPISQAAPASELHTRDFF